jgi:hypothetical protein
MLSAPIWAKKMARKSVYVLTNRRALVFKKQFSSMSIRSFEPDQLHDLERNQRADGTGDLIFKDGLGRTDLPGGDGGQLKDSIRRMGQLDSRWLLSGHGDVVSGSQAVNTNFTQVEKTWFSYV